MASGLSNSSIETVSTGTPDADSSKGARLLYADLPADPRYSTAVPDRDVMAQRRTRNDCAWFEIRFSLSRLVLSECGSTAITRPVPFRIREAITLNSPT